MFQIVITGTQLPYVEKEIAALGDIASVTFKNCHDRDELFRLIEHADAIMTDSEIIDKAAMDHAANLKVIVEYGIGVDNIDVAAATELGIRVCNVPDVFINEVAEHAIALMMAVARNIDGMNRHVREQRSWDFNALPALKLNGKTIGLIGFGNIGRAVARMARGIGMRVVAYDAFVNDAFVRENGCEPCDLCDLLEQADVVSIHVPHTPETHHLIDADAITKMKQEAILINVSRGGVVDEGALAAALTSGRLFGAGIDVLEEEPKVHGNPLLECKNVLITPHMGWKSEVAAFSLEMAAVKEVRSVLLLDQPIHQVNKK